MPYQTKSTTPARDVFSVSRLNAEARSILEGSFPLLWVEGEISNLARPASGHIYFSLKDSHAQVRCAMFRMKRVLLRFQPKNGLQVLIRCRVSLYEGRGEFQLLVEQMEPSGEGALRRAFEALKNRLAAEGLFDAGDKRPIPAYPKTIGVITSAQGAALHDVITVLKRRAPMVNLILYPVPVQGPEAPRAIEETIRLADRRCECDLLLLTRGGGSLEDLMAFNDEGVARSIHEAGTPIISAVGHEIDFTISDFVADLRAATPTAGAELATPDQQELQARVAGLAKRLEITSRSLVGLLSTRLSALLQRLDRTHPRSRHFQRQQRLDELQLRLERLAKWQQEGRKSRLHHLLARLSGRTPRHELASMHRRSKVLDGRLSRAAAFQLERHQRRLAATLSELNALSPLATLERGYSITHLLPERQVVRKADSLVPGDRVETRLASGKITCKVEIVQ